MVQDREAMLEEEEPCSSGDHGRSRRVQSRKLKYKPRNPCFLCDGDHWAMDCPKRSMPIDPSVDQTNHDHTSTLVRDDGKMDDGELLYVEADHNNQEPSDGESMKCDRGKNDGDGFGMGGAPLHMGYKSSRWRSKVCKPRDPCFFCGANHWANQCPKRAMLTERIEDQSRLGHGDDHNMGEDEESCVEGHINGNSSNKDSMISDFVDGKVQSTEASTPSTNKVPRLIDRILADDMDLVGDQDVHNVEKSAEVMLHMRISPTSYIDRWDHMSDDPYDERSKAIDCGDGDNVGDMEAKDDARDGSSSSTNKAIVPINEIEAKGMDFICDNHDLTKFDSHDDYSRHINRSKEDLVDSDEECEEACGEPLPHINMAINAIDTRQAMGMKLEKLMRDQDSHVAEDFAEAMEDMENFHTCDQEDHDDYDPSDGDLRANNRDDGDLVEGDEESRKASGILTPTLNMTINYHAIEGDKAEGLEHMIEGNPYWVEDTAVDVASMMSSLPRDFNHVEFIMPLMEVWHLDGAKLIATHAMRSQSSHTSKASSSKQWSYLNDTCSTQVYFHTMEKAWRKLVQRANTLRDYLVKWKGLPGKVHTPSFDEGVEGMGGGECHGSRVGDPPSSPIAWIAQQYWASHESTHTRCSIKCLAYQVFEGMLMRLPHTSRVSHMWRIRVSSYSQGATIGLSSDVTPTPKELMHCNSHSWWTVGCKEPGAI